MRKNVVIVRFVNSDGSYGNSKNYAYFTFIELNPNDMVVVEARSFYGIARVVKTRGLSTVEKEQATRFVVAKIDISELQACKQRMERCRQIRSELQEAKEEYEETYIYQEMAERDPNVAKLLAELEELEGRESKSTERNPFD